MIIAHPAVLALIAFSPLLGLWRWYRFRSISRQQASLGVGRPDLTPTVSRSRETVANLLAWAALMLIIVALSGPRGGSDEHVRRGDGADLVLAMDCSRSMLAKDLYPDRMAVAQRKAIDLIRLSQGSRIALLPFAGIPVLRCPLTADGDALVRMLDLCSPDLFPAAYGYQGTAIGHAIDSALDVLSRNPQRGAAVIVVSDGGDDDRVAIDAAVAHAKAQGVRLYGLFVGDPQRTVSVPIDGHPVVMKPDRATLDHLAQATGGVCVNTTADQGDVHAILDHIRSHVPGAPWQERHLVMQSQRYQWPLGAALIAWILAQFLRSRRGLPRTALIGALIAMGMVLPSPIHAESQDIPTILAQATAVATHDPAAARSLLEHVLIEHPDCLAADYDLGTLLMSSAPADALPHLQAACASPDSTLATAAWFNLAEAYASLGRLPEAVLAAGRACARDPTDHDAVVMRDELRRRLLVGMDQARLRALAAAKLLHLVTGDLPVGHVGEPYRGRLEAQGGTGPYRFSLAGKSALPPGLRLDPDGGLSGMPETAGNTTVQLAVTDASQGAWHGARLIRILPAPGILTDALPEGVIKEPYQADLSASGLLNPIWSAAGLPPGLAISGGDREKARIIGIPTAVGSWRVGLSAQDAQGTARRSLTLVVGDAFAPDRVRLTPATIWAAYHDRIGIRGPAETYHWRLITPVPGIRIDDQGEVSGSPQTEGDIRLGLEITASDGRHRPASITLPVNPPPLIQLQHPLVLDQGRIVDLAVNESGGTPPFAWKVSSGPLPPGLRLDPDGHLRGAPVKTGDFPVAIGLTDHWGAATQQKGSIQIKAAPPPSDQSQPQSQPQSQSQSQSQPQPQQRTTTPGSGHAPPSGSPSTSPQGGQPSGGPGSATSTSGPRQGASPPGTGEPTPSQMGTGASNGQQASNAGRTPDEGRPGASGMGSRGQAEHTQGSANSATGTGKSGASGSGATGVKAPTPSPGSQGQGSAADHQTARTPDAAHAPGTGTGLVQGQGPAGTGSAPGEAGAAYQAAIDRAQARRWLESLPPEDRGAIRFQLLDGSTMPGPGNGKPW